jgi:hypothetical protein
MALEERGFGIPAKLEKLRDLQCRQIRQIPWQIRKKPIKSHVYVSSRPIYCIRMRTNRFFNLPTRVPGIMRKYFFVYFFVCLECVDQSVAYVVHL